MSDKKKRAMDLFIESVIDPNHELRADAKSQDCFTELMEIRADMIEYLRELRSKI
jgi:hypothetical protein